GPVRRRPPRPLLQGPLPPPGRLPDLRARAISTLWALSERHEGVPRNARQGAPPRRSGHLARRELVMPFAAALSTAAATRRAAAEVCEQAALPGADLALAFFSPHHLHHLDELLQAVHARLAPRVLLGCVAEAVIGNDREVEGGPALSLWLGGWARG